MLVNLFLIYSLLAVINGFLFRKTGAYFFSLVALILTACIFSYWRYGVNGVLSSVSLALIYISCVPAIVEKSPTLELLQEVLDPNYKNSFNTSEINELLDKLVASGLIEKSNNQLGLTLSGKIFLLPFFLIKSVSEIEHI